MESIRRRCKVEGCRGTWYDWGADPNPYMARHTEGRHVVCSCGWVGLDWGKHKGQTVRHGTAWRGCRIEQYVRLRNH